MLVLDCGTDFKFNFRQFNPELEYVYVKSDTANNVSDLKRHYTQFSGTGIVYGFPTRMFLN